MAWYDGIGAGVITGIANIGSSLLGMNFQKKENSITRSREDNAITRQVEDLRNAGMSPLLASGQGASAQSLTAPSFNLDGVGKGIEQAIALKQAKGQLDLMSSQKANNDANTALALANTNVANEQASSIKKQSDWMEANGYRERSPVGVLTQVAYDLFDYLKNGKKNDKSDDSLGDSLDRLNRGMESVFPFLPSYNKPKNSKPADLGGGRSW